MYCINYLYNGIQVPSVVDVELISPMLVLQEKCIHILFKEYHDYFFLFYHRNIDG
jgi:hypothetical protein